MASAIANVSDIGDAKEIGQKTQFQEIAAYLVFPQTVVIERTYVDKGYLADYCNYYATASYPYDRYCHRIHFFEGERPKDVLVEYLSGRTIGSDKLRQCEDALQHAYRGYLVVKPLPHAFIGRTCLLPRAEDMSSLRVGRENSVQVSGLRLVVPALPYQEQDAAVAACASSALWSALHGVMDDFHIRVPALSDLTLLAAEHASIDRTMPSGGLTINQVIHAGPTPSGTGHPAGWKLERPPEAL